MFTTDRKGDQDNLRYGSIDKYKVPKYRTAGHGGLVGLSRRYRVSSSTDADRLVDDLSHDSTRQGRQSLVAEEILENDGHLACGGDNASDRTFIRQEDFIPFDHTQKAQSAGLSSSLADEIAGRRWPSGKKSSVQSASIGENLTSERNHETNQIDAFDRFKSHAANKKHMELSKGTESTPQNVALWQALIDHQEDYYRLTSDVNKSHPSATARRTIAEMRLSLYQKALLKVTEPNGNNLLLAGMMLEGSRVWDTNTQMKEWSRILQKADDFSLRVKYFNFVQQNSILYTYERCLGIYIEEFRHAQHSAGSVAQLAYLTLRLTTLMRTAGYIERAIAIWQALIEINFFKPANIEPDNVKAAFQRFWESEVARIGEDEGTGWSLGLTSFSDARSDPPLPQFQAAQIFEAWSREEESLERTHIFPARTLDETAENDPYRVILFSDIEDFIFVAETTADREVFLMAFLRFCGLPPPSKAPAYSLRWWKDANLSHCQQGIRTETSSGADHLGASLPTYLRTDILSLLANRNIKKGFSNDAQFLHANIINFALNALVQIVGSQPTNDALAEYLIVMRHNVDQPSGLKYSKNLLKKRANHPRLYNVYAILQAVNDRMDNAYKIWSTAISMAESFEETNGRRQRESVILLLHDWVWELVNQKCYTRAMSLLIKGFQDEGFSIMTATVASNNSMDFLEDELLRAKHSLNTSVAVSLQGGEHNCIMWYTNLSVILCYLSSDCSLDEALRAFDSTLTVLTKEQYRNVGECLHQWRARLLELHIKHSPTGYRPSQVTAVIKQSLDMFPENSMLHLIYEKFRRRSGLVDRLRLVNQAQTEVPSPQHAGQESTQGCSTAGAADTIPIQNIAPDILRLSAELSRPLYAGSTPHSIRAAFTKAVSEGTDDSAISLPSRNSSLIWQTWLEWELAFFPTDQAESKSRGNPVIRGLPGSITTEVEAETETKIEAKPRKTKTMMDPITNLKDLKRLKEIYLSALRACPGVKALYMIGFSHPTMRQVLGRQGLVDVYRTMLDRGLRIRIDIEDFLESVGDLTV